MQRTNKTTKRGNNYVTKNEKENSKCYDVGNKQVKNNKVNIYNIEEDHDVNNTSNIYESKNNFKNRDGLVNLSEENGSLVEIENHEKDSFGSDSSKINEKRRIRKNTIVFIFMLVFEILFVLRTRSANRENEMHEAGNYLNNLVVTNDNIETPDKRKKVHK